MEVPAWECKGIYVQAGIPQHCSKYGRVQNVKISITGKELTKTWSIHSTKSHTDCKINKVDPYADMGGDPEYKVM